MLHYNVLNSSLQFRRVEPRPYSSLPAEGCPVRLLFENSLDESSVGGDALIDVHLEPTEHDSDEADTSRVSAQVAVRKAEDLNLPSRAGTPDQIEQFAWLQRRCSVNLACVV